MDDPAAPVEVPAEPVGEKAPDDRSDGRMGSFVVRGAVWLLIAIVLGVSLGEGLQLRKWLYVTFEPIRFRPDIFRGCFWALTSSGPEGYLNQYDKMEPQIPDRLDSRWVPWLDYAPLRLFVLREWGMAAGV
jgi:hypothetical protein